MFDLYSSNGLPYLPQIVLHLLIEINALSIDQLESFGETLFDFESIADLIVWLENYG